MMQLWTKLHALLVTEGTLFGGRDPDESTKANFFEVLGADAFFGATGSKADGRALEVEVILFLGGAGAAAAAGALVGGLCIAGGSSNKPTRGSMLTSMERFLDRVFGVMGMVWIGAATFFLGLGAGGIMEASPSSSSSSTGISGSFQWWCRVLLSWLWLSLLWRPSCRVRSSPLPSCLAIFRC